MIVFPRFRAKEAMNDDVNDSDEIEIVDVPRAETLITPLLTRQAVSSQPMTACHGISLTFPDGQNEHTSYPFGLHNKQPCTFFAFSLYGFALGQNSECSKRITKSKLAFYRRRGEGGGEKRLKKIFKWMFLIRFLTPPWLQ